MSKWDEEKLVACKKLAKVMKEKGIKWIWQEGDWFLPTSGLPRPLIKGQGILKIDIAGAIPLLTFERCLELLKEWGWVWRDLINTWQGIIILRAYKIGSSDESIYIENPDLMVAAIKACVEACERR